MRCCLPIGLTVHLSNGSSRFWSPIVFFSRYFLVYHEVGMTHFIAEVVYYFAGISVEKGAQTTLYLATSPQVQGVTGKYFANNQEKKSARSSYDKALGQSLWKVSEQLVARSVFSSN